MTSTSSQISNADWTYLCLSRAREILDYIKRITFKFSCFYNKHLTHNEWFWWPSTYVCLDVFLMGIHINDRWSICMYLVTKSIDYVRCLLKKHLNWNENRNNETSNKYFGSMDATKTHMWGCMHCLKMTIRIRYEVVQIALLL